MSISEALRAHRAPVREEALETVPRSASTNPYIKVEFWKPWDDSLLRPYGERCKKVIHINDHHILICQRRVFVVGLQAKFSFPPFDSEVRDVHVESLGGGANDGDLLILIGLDHGIQAFVVNTNHNDINNNNNNSKNSGESSLVFTENSFVSTGAPVAKIHAGTQQHMFVVCLQNCQVQILSIDTQREFTTTLVDNTNWWLEKATELFRRRVYRDSFFDSYSGQLVVLSEHDVSLWTFLGGKKEQLVCSTSVGSDAVAVLPTSAAESGTSIGSLVRRSGAIERLELHEPTRLSGKRLSYHRVFTPPEAIQTTNVSRACCGANTTVLYDELTVSIVVVAHGATVFSDTYNSYQCHIVSQINLCERPSGLGFMESKSALDSGIFWVYGSSEALLCIDKLAMGDVFRRSCEGVPSVARRLLSLVDTSHRAEVIAEAALCGQPMETMSRELDALLTPSVVDAHTVRLSAGAVGLVNFFMQKVNDLSRICTSHRCREPTLEKARKRVMRSCILFREYLNAGGWLDAPSTLQLVWHRFQGRCPGTVMTQQIGFNAQAQYLSAVIDIAERASTIVWLHSLLMGSECSPWAPATMASVLWDSNQDDTITDYVTWLLARRDDAIIEKLTPELGVLPLKARLVIDLHKLLPRGEEALHYAQQHLVDIVNTNLMNYVTNLFEAHMPDLAPSIRLLRTYYKHDPSVSTTIISVLNELPATSESLRRGLRCIFESGTSPDLQAVVQDWMEGHSLDDSRIPIFAAVLAESDVHVGISNTLAGRFFFCWIQEARGNALVAARHFGELARTPLEASLSARLLCVQHAMMAHRHHQQQQQQQSSELPSLDTDKHTEFVLLLQRQLSELLQRHLRGPSDKLVHPKEVVDGDLRTLSTTFMDERQLFEVAGRYRELGGASVQLDILKIHGDSPEAVTSDALLSMLTFLRAIGLSSLEAVERVLREYLTTFQATLPIYPFVLFLACDKRSAGDIAEHLLVCGVHAVTVFDTFLRLIDGRGEVVFPVSDTLQALQHTVNSIPSEQQAVCIAHLLECIRGVLAGEYRNITLTESDVFRAKSIESLLKTMSSRR